MELDAEFNEIACISDFKMLTLASETSIYARTAEIKCKQSKKKRGKTVLNAINSLSQLTVRYD